MGSDAFLDIAKDLDGISERLADHAIDLLGEALHDADPKQSPAAKTERVVTRARRSVEKAVALLRSLDPEASGEDF